MKPPSQAYRQLSLLRRCHQLSQPYRLFTNDLLLRLLGRNLSLVASDRYLDASLYRDLEDAKQSSSVLRPPLLHSLGFRHLRSILLLLHLSSQVLRIQKMTLLTLVHLGDGRAIAFTAATPVQPGPSHPEDDPAYAGPSRRRSYDSPLGSFRHSSRQGSDTPPHKRRRL